LGFLAIKLIEEDDMKRSKIRRFVVLASILVLAGVGRLASAQTMVGPTPTVTPTNALKGFIESGGKNFTGVAESTEKGTNGSENSAKGKMQK
jgi:hypothetical protein